MAQRARRRNSEPRKAPDWVPDELLDRLGLLLREEGFPKQARKVGRFWTDRLDILLDHAGGSVPPAELLEPIEELEERYGLPRVALTMLRVGLPSPLASGVIDRFLANDGLPPLPVDADGDGDGVPARPASTASPETLLKERDRIAEDLRRERERTRDKDRKLREEREAHAATRSELTSERDKLRNALRDLEKQLASGPSSEVITAALEARNQAEDTAEEARRGAREAESRAASAEAATRRADAALEAARSDVDAARAEAERLRAAPPSTTDLVRAARHVGAAALLRLESPAPGDAELLEVIAAVTRWQTASGGSARRMTRAAAPPEPPPPPEPSPAATAQTRTRAGRARAAARAIGGPLQITIAGGGGIGSSAYVLEFGGARILLDCGIGGAGMYSALPERLDAVVLTHAHGDHMGGLPELLRRQSDLRVYCSKSTKLLATYQANAADEYIPGDRLLVRDPGETYRILDGAVDLTLHRVAHILGSCAVRLRFADDRVVVYSGDLGGTGLRTLRPADPLPLAGANAVLLESTLGDRGPIRASHEATLIRELAGVVDGDGCAVLPAASVGRAQELAALLAEQMAAGKLPDAPVLMTPLARRVLDRYRAGDRDGWLADIDYPDVGTLRPEESADEIVARPSYVIVGGASALERRSGQLAFAAAQRPACGVFFTGYSGANARQRTTGDVFEFVGEDGTLQRTEITCRWGWAPSPDHASQRELVQAVSALQRDAPLLLVHGVEDAKKELGDKLRTSGHQDVRALHDGDVVEIA
jgi:metallo-beta-lactamase family protein